MRQVVFRALRVIVILAVACPVIMIVANYFTPLHPANDPRHPEYESSGAYARRPIFTSSFPFMIPYMLFVPDDYDPAKKYPLVLVLHGSNKDSFEASVLVRPLVQEAHPCFVVMPLAPFVETWALPEGPQFQNWGRYAMPYAMQALEAVESGFSIDKSRIYVTGVSSGGFGAFGAIIQHPETFAAAVIVAGGWIERDAYLVPHIPIWMFHSNDDPQIPVSYPRGMYLKLKQFGIDVKYTEYGGLNHGGAKFKAFADEKLWEWLFAQRRPNAAPGRIGAESAP